jgi:hypothetical protein
MSQSNSLPESTSEIAPVNFSEAELEKHRGHWLAFSPDGQRVIASSRMLKELEKQIRAAGADPEEVLLDHLPESDAIQFGSELS